MAEVKERNTEERATRMAERIWRETIDDSKLDIKRIRAICLFYLIAERDQAVASHAPATAGVDKLCQKVVRPYGTKIEDLCGLPFGHEGDCVADSPALSAPQKENDGNKSHRGMDSAMDDNRIGQQSDRHRTPISYTKSGGIFAKDAAKWLREKWPHRPMTTGGLPDESLQPHYQPTRKDVERWLVEYAMEASPIEFAPSAPATGKEGLPYWQCPNGESHALSMKGLPLSAQVPYCTVCPSRVYAVFKPKPTATQSGASATQGDLIREVEICEQNCSAWIPCKTQDVRSLLAEVETLKAERDSWREVCNQILTLRGKNKDLERTVSELRSRMDEALKTDEVKP